MKLNNQVCRMPLTKTAFFNASVLPAVVDISLQYDQIVRTFGWLVHLVSTPKWCMNHSSGIYVVLMRPVGRLELPVNISVEPGVAQDGHSVITNVACLLSLADH